ncbi:bifunctional diaminohydroxyphosphoribosylaminopyrimidine deaminase/5-amino-6-(5-phosphoribosylamino)uracil reductase RibD [Rhodoferax sp. AJA081-3]|uniref:bifunctional diaminohydroxyphosphoribosylaminopyrimidine deaminase/5-amino-6-(5-phosphoribosylamino)uracil reductase RibD n=1 Tax=Rhodoferax sp. AJA081-3 TaxID=2752316 RepID=UPI001AE05F8C|nr:bifunctional diaminohydroxyphosphoribosylaminopyrimidine deaminase/5-amino-6-(5-phosphoribosylamino)uracil reductase RibD [Rhodoferax sp. AJA081-3]QTN29286.1 bifunctional diaminohydroxyphosphoribosylaminopyrimidine deaminase/5-amino-6-(5-phosphoribosylamino)uracil reductase RibD [Rhodoferax sp. AJA081-3]
MEELRAALILAAQVIQNTPPNPSVGCILIAKDCSIVGRGMTQLSGGPHAEVMALRDAQAKGHSVVDATAYVTLEPCSHHGRTGPCCDALIAAGIKKVVATIADPNPLVAGQGFARLRAAGVEVEVLAPSDPLAQQSRELNIGFFSRMVRKTPWVRMKIAASLDGKTALENGTSQWITSSEARADGHTWRARSGAILTGIGTVLQDNPRLDVRLEDVRRQPPLVIVDSSLQTPVDAAIFVDGRPLYIYCAQKNEARQKALEARGATVIHLPGALPDGSNTGKVDLTAMLHDLGRREVNELHVEAGQRLNGALIREGLVDELLLYLAPKLLGQGRDMAGFGPLDDLGEALQLDFLSTQMVGPDLRLLARVRGRDVF